MKVWSSSFFAIFVSVTGTISICPSAYGRSICCCGVSGAGSGSIRWATITELVLSSLFQKSGTVSDLLDARGLRGRRVLLGRGRLLHGHVDVVLAGGHGDRPADTNRRRLARHDRHEADVLVRELGTLRRVFLVVLLGVLRVGRRGGRGVLRDHTPVEGEVAGGGPGAIDSDVNGAYCLLPCAFMKSAAGPRPAPDRSGPSGRPRDRRQS